MLNHNFMRFRPATGKAFYCANDVLMLVSIYARGTLPEQESTSNDRSIKILIENRLLKKVSDEITITKKGREVVENIIGGAVEGVGEREAPTGLPHAIHDHLNVRVHKNDDGVFVFEKDHGGTNGNKRIHMANWSVSELEWIVTYLKAHEVT